MMSPYARRFTLSRTTSPTGSSMAPLGEGGGPPDRLGPESLILCLAGAPRSSFVARVLRDDPTEGICWFCRALGWVLTQPSREPGPAAPRMPSASRCRNECQRSGKNGPHSLLRRKLRTLYQIDQLISAAVNGIPVTTLITR